MHGVVYKSLANKRYSIAAFLDLEKTYDMIYREGLVHKLCQLGINGNMLTWIYSFFTYRTIQVRVNSTLSNSLQLQNGIPQGSVLSPILFAVMISDLPENMTSTIKLYADDCCLWNTGLKAEEANAGLQRSLDKVTE